MNKFNVEQVSADAVVKAKPATIMAVLLTAPTNDADIVLYDNTSAASGTKAIQISALNGTTSFVDLAKLGGIKCLLGIYADITGTNAACTVWYE